MVRLAVAAVLLAVVAVGWWWAATSGSDAGAEVVTGEFRIAVVGRDGWADDRIVTAAGTPLEVLLAGAAAGNYTVEVEEQPWIGRGCTAHYVVGIAGQRESSTGGWNYYVRGPGEGWSWRPEGAACYVLEAGEQVEWCWVEVDVCRHHAP